ncbi:MAG: Tat pathway signal sequence domain protein [Candidatus Sumerlaeota bacterium]|nr:Tat pathway signal sequence domain protein [Candidatus Sumerlaeota bacterium]
MQKTTIYLFTGIMALLALLVPASRLYAEASSPVAVQVDWPEFLKRHDLVFETLPENFDFGAFLGNGLLGATIYRDGANRLRFEMGRSDVTEHRRDNGRLPIGGLVLETCGKIMEGTMRLDLWNAEVRGEVKTEKGSLQFRALIHTDLIVLIIELEASDGEKDAKFIWNARPAADKRNSTRLTDSPNPTSTTETIEGVSVCVQPRFAGGEFASAFREVPIKNAQNARRIYMSIADSFPASTARKDVVATLQKAAAGDFPRLLETHRAWWHDFYPRSFVSIPDTQLESFYWIQFYKLASASRPDRPPVDLLGPWYRDTGWPRIWWNLNIQTLYLPVYAGNHLELGESFINFMDAKRANFARNAKEIWKFDDCATVPHTTDNEGLRGDGTCAPDNYINPGDFTWALHNYWQHYRYSMDESMVTDQKKHAFYPLLRGSVNLYLHLLKKGDDGKLHLPVLHSPEYGNDSDNNYNLSLLRWACQTLIALNQRYNLNDPLLPKWQETLKDLVDYQADEKGLRIGAGMSFTKSHRHWSHILMVHPLHIMDLSQPANRDLIVKSINHWLTVGGGAGVFGWSRAAAASLYAALGDGDNAIDSIHKHLSNARFVRPNTMYIEGSPVIECSIVLARSLQDMLLQSWGGTINIFPAIPKAWNEAVFHDLRAEGAFLVSAERKGGKTVWARVKSLAGEPLRIKPGMDGEVKALVDGKSAPLKTLAGGVYEIALAKGAEALFFVGDTPPTPVIKPLAADPANCNFYGSKLHAAAMATSAAITLKPALSSGKPAKASSVWGRGLEAAKAFDDNTGTRWALHRKQPAAGWKWIWEKTPR